MIAQLHGHNHVFVMFHKPLDNVSVQSIYKTSLSFEKSSKISNTLFFLFSNKMLVIRAVF